MIHDPACPSHEGDAEPAWAELTLELLALRSQLLAVASAQHGLIQQVQPDHRPSAVNLAHYIALRQTDLRGLQARLSQLGLSSLGRSETDVLANLDRVISLLLRLTGRTVSSPERLRRGLRRDGGPARLQRNAQALFGRAPADRRVRIMVTLPSNAARDPRLVEALVTSGMDIARINCAHDTAADWQAMASEVRRAAGAAGRPVRILMDMAGPKLRTGPLASGPAALRLKVPKDALGQVTAPALLGLRPAGSQTPISGAACCLGVDAAWLDALQPGRTVRLTDARGAKRKLEVLERQAGGLLLACERSVYLGADTVLTWRHKNQPDQETRLHDLPQAAGAVHLRRGDTLWVLPSEPGVPMPDGSPGDGTATARISCTLPAVLSQAQPGQRIWFDDGRLGGLIEAAGPEGLRVKITRALDGGDKLLADKGINLPDTALDLPALTDKDIEDLQTAARVADIVGLSFTQSAADVQALQTELARMGGRQPGLLLKIETRRGFENLPSILLAAMGSAQAGVMIARGDLAVECGWERLAEVQEEILWACEAAHMPVVWATQVLESLAKTGFPSRAEITDAAMGERAECVMLNKGPHILDAMRTLDDILRRMQEHQAKKRPLLRALKAWSQPETPPPQLPSVRPAKGTAGTAPADDPCAALPAPAPTPRPRSRVRRAARTPEAA